MTPLIGPLSVVLAYAVMALTRSLLRLYSPMEPFFTKKWRPSEIELVKSRNGEQP